MQPLYTRDSAVISAYAVPPVTVRLLMQPLVCIKWDGVALCAHPPSCPRASCLCSLGGSCFCSEARFSYGATAHAAPYVYQVEWSCFMRPTPRSDPV